MDINFWLTTPVDLNNGLDRPLGGAEVSAVQLAEQLACKGHDVSIYCNVKETTYSRNIALVPYFKIRNSCLEFLIVVRAHPLIAFRTDRWMINKPDHVIVWSGDAFDQPNNRLFEDKRCADIIDAFVCKSVWQKKTLAERFPLIKDKLEVIINGVNEYDIPEGVVKCRNKFIHASTFYRGADEFLHIWPRIKKEIPYAQLDMYIKTSLYVDDNPQDEFAKDLFKALESLDGVRLHDPVPQNVLMRELAESYLMLYPNNHFLESSCGVAQQSILCGTPVITSARAALPETVGTEGICIDGDPSSKEYEDAFVEAVLRLYNDPNEYNKMSERGRDRIKSENWDVVSDHWIHFLRSIR